MENACHILVKGGWSRKFATPQVIKNVGHQKFIIMNYIDKDTLKNLDLSFTEELKDIEDDVLQNASEIAGKSVNIHSLHGYIGGKNNMYVNSIMGQFPSPDDFIGQWVDGLLAKVKKIEDEQREKYSGNTYQNTATHRMVRLVKEPLIFKYFILFLKRNFYRNLIERTRLKPDDVHWTLWFGDNQIPWGLIIAPAYRNGTWTNDVSEIRRSNYMYWTIGHILSAGIIDPEIKDPVKFDNLDSFMTFYRSVLKRLSKSTYEKQIVDHYLSYLNESKSPLEEPFLIPELRYAGLEKKHLYRLDFSILNSHTMEYVGFELSPQSSHMSVAGTKKRLQKEINEELKKKNGTKNQQKGIYFS